MGPLQWYEFNDWLIECFGASDEWESPYRQYVKVIKRLDQFLRWYLQRGSGQNFQSFRFSCKHCTYNVRNLIIASRVYRRTRVIWIIYTNTYSSRMIEYYYLSSYFYIIIFKHLWEFIKWCKFWSIYWIKGLQIIWIIISLSDKRLTDLIETLLCNNLNIGYNIGNINKLQDEFNFRWMRICALIIIIGFNQKCRSVKFNGSFICAVSRRTPKIYRGNLTKISTNIFITGLSERKKTVCYCRSLIISVEFFWIYVEYIVIRIAVLFSPSRSVDL